ncbi:triacylglycerol esterase/lipase EstA (alpha/beta hydrolase family) [Pseudonocardia sediminis]|uniref:Triacylglycerol esterase/lipase EstA (Alpha/beta hydrolase family) n=1 Tax=Pseudonocardia sediminis TaxID=1397368 RepID=A0A4Q7V4R9_PSEST|nr:lipase [Pseudonocardia sediminis]RZT87619.1 triacylglycerol esterase/lipase EstA (alpha/beta hydrolase family) [Pseudonocardia sediminis]
MSPRRKLLLGLLALAVVAVVVTVLVPLVGSRDSSGSGAVAQDRPGTVLLVPGYGGSRAGLLQLAGRIESTGRQTQVLTLEGDGTGDLNRQVDVLDAAVDTALQGGAPSVDVVGYSAGGVVTGLWAARDDGAAKARRVVTLGSPLHGTTLATLGSTFAPDACPQACRQLAPGSSLLGELDADRVGAEIPWLSLWTTRDETVTPPDSARLDGATNVELQQLCAGAEVSHSGLPTDEAVTGLVLRALSTAPIGQAPADCGTLRAAARA